MVLYGSMRVINKFLGRFKKDKSSLNGVGNSTVYQGEPLITPRSEHNISRSMINKSALQVLYGLKDAGFEAYLVGGCVRDLLLGYEPKDFDVATNASPEQVNTVFRRSRLIGRRFKLVHVRFGRDIIEVATFRAPPKKSDSHVDEKGRIVRDNVYGTLEQDAWRRDFTINALYYSISDFSIIDYTGGMDDLKAGQIRLIGNVETRYREDPVRILRAIRFVGKLGLKLDAETERLIPVLANLLTDIPAARLFDEILKLFLSGQGLTTYELLTHYDVFSALFPQTGELLHHEYNGFPRVLLANALANTDSRIAEGKPVTPAFLFAALLWEPVRQRWAYHQQKIPAIPALQKAAGEIIESQVERVAIPRRFTVVTKDIWVMQVRLGQRRGKRAFRVLSHPKFRAAYDFLLLRSESGEQELTELAAWWTRFQEETIEEQQNMVNSIAPAGNDKKRPRRRHRKKPEAKS